jgi:hypothetical protein
MYGLCSFQISITAKLGIINIQFYRFLRPCSSKVFFVLRWSTYCSSEETSLPSVDSVKEDYLGLLNKEKFIFGVSAFRASWWFCITSCKRELFKAHFVLISFAWSLLFYVFSSFRVCFFVSPLFFFSMLFPFLLLGCQLVASIMSESSCYFWTCDRNSVHSLLVRLTYTNCEEKMKSVGKL